MSVDLRWRELAPWGRLTRSFDFAALRFASFRFAQDERGGVGWLSSPCVVWGAPIGWLGPVLRLRCTPLCSVPLRSGRTEGAALGGARSGVGLADVAPFDSASLGSGCVGGGGGQERRFMTDPFFPYTLNQSSIYAQYHGIAIVFRLLTITIEDSDTYRRPTGRDY